MTPRIRVIVLGFCACLAPAHAQSPAVASAPGPPRAACSQGARGALSELACELSAALSAAPPGLLVVASPVRSDLDLRDGPALSRRLASVVAGALGRDARGAPDPADLGRARSLARDASALLHLEIELARGELRVTADMHRARTSFWERVRDPRPAPLLHAFVSRRLDPEVRTYLAPVPLVVSRIDKATTDESEPVALGCDDIDGDGSLELLLVGRRRITTGRLRAGRFVTLAAASWADLSPIAQSPLREPIAAAVTRTGSVDVGLSDRAQGVRLDASLTALEKWGRRIPWAPEGCARLAGLSLAPSLEACSTKDPKPLGAAFGEPADAVGGAVVLSSRGSPRRVRAGRLFNQGVVVLRDDAGRKVRVEGAGAELAVADLDEDGQPELVSSADTLTAGGDALIVRTWLDDGHIRERLRVGVPAGIRALAACPREGQGMRPVALASPGQIWVVR
jgi:hypothetical protein